MRILAAAPLVLMLGIFSGCAGQQSSEAAVSPAAESKPGKETDPAVTNEVVVRFCQGADEAQIVALLQRHKLSLGKRSSPSLATLTWQDERSIENVLEGLRQEQAVICAAQPNYRYEIQPR